MVKTMPVNRAMLFNIGFQMALNTSKNFWDCFIFHDVDLLAEDDRNLYNCPTKPRHMSVGEFKIWPKFELGIDWIQ